MLGSLFDSQQSFGTVSIILAYHNGAILCSTKLVLNTYYYPSGTSL